MAGKSKNKPTREEKKLSAAFLQMTIFPLIFLSVVVVFIASNLVNNALQREIRRELKNTAAYLEVTLDKMYEGAYQMVEVQDGSALSFNKGAIQLSGQYELLDQYKASTEQEISIFYQSTRVLSTLTDGEGHRYIGTTAHAKIVNDVLTEDHEAFYTNVEIDGEIYYAYYRPLYNTLTAVPPTKDGESVEEAEETVAEDNSEGELFGMIGIAKPKRDVRIIVWASILPIIYVALISLLLAAYGATKYSKGLLKALLQTENFLEQVAKGNLSSKLSTNVTGRKDEIGKMGRAAVAMQRSLSELIEKDALTGIYNRRYGAQKLKSVWEQASKTGLHFAVAIADIDFFKKVNDTYGHEAGDAVLKEVAEILNRRMSPGSTVIRWGGEEFLLIFEDMNLDDAATCLESVRGDIEDNMIIFERKVIRVTMTIGVTEGDSKREIDQVISAADAKLYEGKQGGRNRVVK